MKSKNKWIIVAIIVLILIIIAIATFFVLKNTILLPKTKIAQKENLTFEINSEVKLLSLIESIENGSIISEDILIDTSTLGEKEITIKYLNERNKENDYIIKIMINDTQKPVIESENEYTTEVGTEINLLEKAKVTDNSKEEITPTIEGEYAFNVEGEYKLKFIAIDSSNNRAEKEFTFKVTPKPVEETKPTTPTTSNKKTTTNKSNTQKSNSSKSNSNNSNSSSNSNSSDNNSTWNYEEEKAKVLANEPKKYTVWNYDPKLGKNYTYFEGNFFWEWDSLTTINGERQYEWIIKTDSNHTGGAVISSKPQTLYANAQKYMPAKPSRDGKYKGEKVGSTHLWLYVGNYRITNQ